MFFSKVADKAQGFFNWLDRKFRFRGWLPVAAVLLTLISITFTYPKYHWLKDLKKASEEKIDSSKVFIPQIVEMQIKNPLYSIPASGGSHIEKRQFRLTMPVLGKVLNLHVFGLVIIQQIAGICLLGFVIFLGAYVAQDRVTGLLLGLGFCFIYPGTACFTDMWPWFDGIAYFCMAAAMITRFPWLCAVLLFMAYWTDERALVASPLILLWWKLRQNELQQLTWKKIITPDWYSISIIVSWLAYFGLRTYLIKVHHFQFHTGGITDGPVIKAMYPTYLFGLFTGMEYYSLLLLIAACIMVWKRMYMLAFLFIAVIGLSTFTALMVSDNTKSIAYLFPGIFIGYLLLRQIGERVLNIRYLTLALTFACFILVNNIIINPFQDWIDIILGPVFMEPIRPFRY